MFDGFIGQPKERGEISLDLPGIQAVSLEDLAKDVNQQAGFKLLDKKAIQKNRIRVLHEGTPVPAKEWKLKAIHDNDKLSIIVPLVGG